MEVIQFKNNTDELRPLLEKWKGEANGNKYGVDIDLDVWLSNIQALITSDSAIVYVLKTYEGEIVGCFCVKILPSPVGKQLFAYEEYWYVLPEHRGIGGMRLLVTAKNWAKEKGCAFFLVHASNLAGDMYDKICNMYEKLGMRKFETLYIY